MQLFNISCICYKYFCSRFSIKYQLKVPEKCSILTNLLNRSTPNVFLLFTMLISWRESDFLRNPISFYGLPNRMQSLYRVIFPVFQTQVRLFSSRFLSIIGEVSSDPRLWNVLLPSWPVWPNPLLHLQYPNFCIGGRHEYIWFELSSVLKDLYYSC